ncbi:MAG: RIP metalloprotease RseP [Candidatus Saccharibacteria bacterium]
MIILLTIALFILVLGLLVFVHELGHFVAAKRAGMQVEEFGFGFPPRIFGIKRGDTLYSINLIPLGGFVRIAGEDGGETENPKSFGQKSFSRRLAVLIAGVMMNAVFAWLLISIGLGTGLPTIVSENEQLPAHARARGLAVGIVEVSESGPAGEAGVKVGDKIIKIAGSDVKTIEDAQALTRAGAGQPTTYTLGRGSATIEKTITPRVDPPAGQGPLGISLSSIALVSYPWYLAPIKGITATVNLLVSTVTGIATILGQWITGKSVSAALSGPVGIAVMTRDIAALGIPYLIQFTAVLSINLSIINAIPFPALDGGRVLFLAIERIRRRKLPQTAEQVANTVGFFLLLLLMAFVTYKDITRLGGNLFGRIGHLFGG